MKAGESSSLHFILQMWGGDRGKEPPVAAELSQPLIVFVVNRSCYRIGTQGLQ